MLHSEFDVHPFKEDAENMKKRRKREVYFLAWAEVELVQNSVSGWNVNFQLPAQREVRYHVFYNNYNN